MRWSVPHDAFCVFGCDGGNDAVIRTEKWKGKKTKRKSAAVVIIGKSKI